MQQIEFFLKTLAKPLLQFANGVWNFVIRVDKWYKVKSDSTKCSIRWGLICTTLVGLNINERIESDARADADNNRNTLLLNNEKKSLEDCEKRYLERLEMEIQKLEKYDRRVQENDEKIKQLK